MKSTTQFPFVRRPLPHWLVPALQDVRDKMADDATGHDFLHAVRVMELAGEIAEELGADAEAAMTAGLLHDYYRAEEKATGQLHFGPEAMRRLRRRFSRMLADALGEERFNEVLEAISLHEQYDFQAGRRTASLPLTAQILQDADRLEALGAVGVARTFMFGGAHGLPMVADDAATDAPFDPCAKPAGSTHRHIYAKLLRLAERMHTAPGRRLAAERHEFMLRFLRQFERELGVSPPNG